jgi:hypothetical protein
MGFKPLSNAPYPTHQAMQIAEADRFVKKIKELQQFLTNKMTLAQSVYKAIVNKKRTLAPAYQIGNFVWLNIRNLNTK